MFMYGYICLYLFTFNTGCYVCLLDNLGFRPIRETTNLLSSSFRIFSGNIQTSMRASFLHCVKIWIH